MYTIRLDGLNKAKARRWLENARRFLETDPVYAFVSAWIVFNYYYGTFSGVDSKSFIEWARQNASGSDGDKAQWRYLVSQPALKTILVKYFAEGSGHPEITLDLPVINMRNGRRVPEDVSGCIRICALSPEQLFGTLYQIRNNLLHGMKDPAKDTRDLDLSKRAAEFLVPFCFFLIEQTGPAL